jgi:hypothetical protein
MDLKKEVRRRIEELTRLAYERGYRDGAESALAEIEKAAGEDLAEQLKESPASLPALQKAAAAGVRRRAAAKRQKVRQPTAKPNGAAPPKAVTVQRCIQKILTAKGEARRDEVLAAARAENRRITSQDVLNGIRTLTQRAEIRVDPEEKSRLLPSEGLPEQMPAS